jgi:GGDEF domain-containing protein
MFAWMTATDVAFAMVAVTQAVMAGLWRVGASLMADIRAAARLWAAFAGLTSLGFVLLIAALSIGLAQWSGDAGEDMSRLLVRADAALYQAKQAGRNRVVGAAPGTQAPGAGDAGLAAQPASAWRP